MYCKYCRIFHESEEKTKNGNYCFVTRKYKINNENACEGFVLNHFFWCKKKERREEMVVCLHIQKKLREEPEKYRMLYQECKKCKDQKKEIIELHRGVRGGKPVLVKRPLEQHKLCKADEKKPILILKRKPVLIKRKGN